MFKIQSAVPSHRLWSLAVACFAIFVLIGSIRVFAQTPVPTVTELAVTSGGVSVSSVPQGSLLTLTATVTAGSDPVTAGQVLFCNASAPLCTDINQLGTAQITPAGTATLKTHLGLGTHTVKAVYLGTPNGATGYEGSSSVPLDITVVGLTSTTLTASGSSGSYTLTATVADHHSLIRPTGSVSFLDTTNGNVIVATAPLANIKEGNSTLFVPSTLSPEISDVVALTGDFNGDGNLDLVVQGNDNLIAFGNGDGTFTLSAPFAAGIHPSLAGDFNNDGKLDLVAGNGQFLLGNGDGTFSSGPNFPLSSTLAVGDFNNDGNLDVLGSDASSLVMLLGRGDGTFTSVSLVSSIATPYNGTVLTGDFNGDGKLDVALGTGVILLGNGDGTFSQGATLPGTPFAAADFNGDGKLDLLGNRIYLNNGDGTFTQGPVIGFNFNDFIFLSVTSAPVLVGDFNGDGIADIEFNSSFSTGGGPGCHVSALSGKGDGTFPKPRILIIQVPRAPQALA